jgi:pimeloyl-ACP methyl ester carboxylesterase
MYVDHRGLGRSDKPHDPDAYAMSLRAADAVAVIDELDIERAHFIGMSWEAGSASASVITLLNACCRSSSAASSPTLGLTAL